MDKTEKMMRRKNTEHSRTHNEQLAESHNEEQTMNDRQVDSQLLEETGPSN